MSDGPALERGAGVTLDLDELVLLRLWGLDVGHLDRQAGLGHYYYRQQISMNRLLTTGQRTHREYSLGLALGLPVGVVDLS